MKQARNYRNQVIKFRYLLQVSLLFLFCSQFLAVSQIQQKQEWIDDISKSIVMNQRLEIDYDRNVHKFAFSYEVQRKQSQILSSCDVYQRTVKTVETYVEDFDFQKLKLDTKDSFLITKLIGSTFISVSKQGFVSLYSINKQDTKLTFIDNLNLKLNSSLDYQPIIVVKDQKQAYIILKDQLILIDVEGKFFKTTEKDQVNFEGMKNNAIYNQDILYVPLKSKGLMKIKLQVDASNNIVIIKQEKITKISSNQDESKTQITDIYYSNKLDKFFILDYNQGIFITDDTFTNPQQIQDVEKGYSFGLYENTNKQITIIVIQDGISIPKGQEIYIDASETPYKTSINKDKPIRLNEAPWSKVFVFDHFCIFQGKATHSVNYHSTIQDQEDYFFNRIPDFLTKEPTNSIIILNKNFEPYNPSDLDFIAFSFFSDGYSTSNINVQAPQFICHPKQEEQEGVNQYSAVLYTNHCISDKTSNIWIQQIQVDTVLVDDQNGLLIAGIVVGSLVGVLIIIFCIYNGIRKYKARIQGLQREILQLSSTSKSNKYQEMKQED